MPRINEETRLLSCSTSHQRLDQQQAADQEVPDRLGHCAGSCSVGVECAVVAFFARAHERAADPYACGDTKSEAGYVKWANKQDDHYFYRFFESRSDPETDPLVLWPTGGPGSSSMFALLTENGPCTIQPDLSVQLNPYSWNKTANVVWLDQPTGVGFSCGSRADKDHNETNGGETIYWFMQGFMDKHPQYRGREFFVTGESYGGHYVPAAAHYIWSKNKAGKADGEASVITTQGIVIGNGLTNLVVQVR